MRELPEGTVTFLFTDIVGSTRLLQEMGDEYAGALTEHRRVLRGAFGARGGVEVDTQGDALFYAFDTASEAVAAAVEGQDALAGGAIGVRMGLHTGEPIRGDEGYVGLDVHRGARIASAGNAGQILLSQTVRDLSGWPETRELGDHRLRDVGTVRLFQIGHQQFAPIKSLGVGGAAPSLSRLIGRERELKEVTYLIREGGARLVTLLGPGGIGKTRLAREVMSDLSSAFTHGAWFVDLSAVRESALVQPAIMSVLGIPGSLPDHARDREMLLVLDNLEQVIEVAPELAGLLHTAPRLVILVTSREALRVTGEQEINLDPLPQPAAAELFLQRARAMKHDFEGDLSQIAELCRRLDRIPLAIELAAARLRMFTVDQLLSRLDRRLLLLTGGARDLPARQRTLRDTIEWSYELLSAEERRLFGFLAVFRGGWTLEAAESVCGGELDGLQSLVDKSLVRFDSGRFTMLDTIHEFALEELTASPNSGEIHDQHAAYYSRMAENAARELTGHRQSQNLALLEVDYENLREALEWTGSSPHLSETMVRIASSLVMFWFVRGRLGEGLEWVRAALQHCREEECPGRGALLWGLGLFSALTGDLETAGSSLDKSTEIGRDLGDDSLVARSLDALGLVAFFRNDLDSASILFEQSIEFARKANDRFWLADALGTLGSIDPLLGRFERGERLAREGLEIARTTGEPQGIRMALFALALSTSRRGYFTEARALGLEGLQVSEDIGDRWFESYFLWILATVEVLTGAIGEAREYAERGLKVARELNAPLLLACSLSAVAAAAQAEGDVETASGLYRESEAIGRTGTIPYSFLAETVLGMGDLEASLGHDSGAIARYQESVELAKRVGLAWSEARGLTSLAMTRVYEGDAGGARELITSAIEIFLETGDIQGLSEATACLAFAAGIEGDWLHGASLFGASRLLRDRTGVVLASWRADREDKFVGHLSQALGADALRKALEGGARLAEASSTQAFLQGENLARP